MDEVVVLFESQVDPAAEPGLVDAFLENSSGPLPEGMIEMRLLHDASVSGRWAIESRWRDREPMDRYRAAEDPPREVLAFRSVGAEPVASVYEVIRAEVPLPAD